MTSGTPPKTRVTEAAIVAALEAAGIELSATYRPEVIREVYPNRGTWCVELRGLETASGKLNDKDTMDELGLIVWHATGTWVRPAILRAVLSVNGRRIGMRALERSGQTEDQLDEAFRLRHLMVKARAGVR